MEFVHCPLKRHPDIETNPWELLQNQISSKIYLKVKTGEIAFVHLQTNQFESKLAYFDSYFAEVYPWGLIDNKSGLVQVMYWRWISDTILPVR